LAAEIRGITLKIKQSGVESRQHSPRTFRDGIGRRKKRARPNMPGSFSGRRALQPSGYRALRAMWPVVLRRSCGGRSVARMHARRRRGRWRSL